MILLLIWVGTGSHPKHAHSLTAYTVCASGAYTCPGSEGVKKMYTKKQKELLKI